MGEEPAGPTHAGLDLVKDKEQATLVAELPEIAELGGRERPHAALALDRLNEDGGSLRTDRRLQRRTVAERHLIEALDLRSEAFEVLRLAPCRDRRQRAAVEGALERDDAEALRRAVHIMVAPRRLDRAFDRFDARIGEEDPIREGGAEKPAAERALAFDLEDVRDVPQLFRLRLQRRDEMRMRMAEHVDRDS